GDICRPRATAGTGRPRTPWRSLLVQVAKEPSMNCPQCGTLNFPGFKFCRECGQLLGTAGASAVASVNPEAERLLREGFALLERGDLEGAAGAANAALALEPADPAGHSLLAVIFERAGRIEEAVDELEWVLGACPGSLADRRKLEELKARRAAS